MPEESKEESKSEELDLSNLDSLLTDLEKDLPNIEADLKKEIPAAPTIQELPPPQDPHPAQSLDEPEDVTPEELLASPIHPPRDNIPPDSDELEEMFTDEEEPVKMPDDAPDRTERTHEIAPSVPAAPPVVAESRPIETPVENPPATEVSFEDALELDEPPPAAAPAPPPAIPANSEATPSAQEMAFEDALEMEPEPKAAEPVLISSAPPAETEKATMEGFQRALKDKKFEEAARMGRTLLTPDSSAAFRINLAGALFYAGLQDDAERQLSSLLEQSPYHIAARRNLEVVKAGRR